MALTSLKFRRCGHYVRDSLPYPNLLLNALHRLDKEVQGYYEDGMRVPDDVTLLWADDKYVRFSCWQAMAN